MNEPTVNHYGDSWEYLWPDIGAAVGFASLRESRGELHGEIWVGLEAPTSNAGGKNNGHLVWGSFNLSSPQTRSKMAVTCQSRSKRGTVDQWISMLEFACLNTAEQHRRGEPVFDLADAEAPTQVDYLITPLLPVGEVTSLVADGESGKSVAALGLALSLRLGGIVIPGLCPTRQVNTLYLDWETSVDEHRRRLQMLCTGLGIHARPSGIFYRHMTRALADDQVAVREIIDRQDIGFVIIDSAGPATGAELKESEPVIRLFGALRTFTPTKLLLGHLTKASASSGNSERGRMFGSVFFENLSRSVWEARSDSESDPIEIGFFHRKSNMGRKQKPFAVSLKFDDSQGAAVFKGMSVYDSPNIAEHAPLSVRMAAALRRGQLTTSELAEELGVSAATIRMTGRRSETVGAVRQLTPVAGKGGRGKEAVWGLAANEEMAKG